MRERLIHSNDKVNLLQVGAPQVRIRGTDLAAQLPSSVVEISEALQEETPCLVRLRRIDGAVAIRMSRHLVPLRKLNLKNTERPNQSSPLPSHLHAWNNRSYLKVVEWRSVVAPQVLFDGSATTADCCSNSQQFRDEITDLRFNLHARFQPTCPKRQKHGKKRRDRCSPSPNGGNSSPVQSAISGVAQARNHKLGGNHRITSMWIGEHSPTPSQSAKTSDA